MALTAEQKAARRMFIGGSDAPRIMRGDWRALWAEKTGRSQGDDLSRVLPVQLGSYTEPFNRAWFELQTGRKVEHFGHLEQSPSIPWMAINLDGITTATNGKRAYWDAKHVGRADETTVMRYVAQMTHGCEVTGCEWWILSFLIGNSRWEMVEQPLDHLYAAELCEWERKFWSYVERDEEPPEHIPGLSTPPPLIDQLRKISLEDASRTDWPNWGGDMVELLGKYAATYDQAQVHEIAKREIKELLPADVGLVTRGNLRIARDKAGAVRVALKKGSQK